MNELDLPIFVLCNNIIVVGIIDIWVDQGGMKTENLLLTS